MSLLFRYVLLFLSVCSLYGLDADISFVVVDFKFSDVFGLKICEVQHGADSAFRGDRAAHGQQGTIVPHFLEQMQLLGKPVGIIPKDLADHGIRNLAKNHPLLYVSSSLKKLLKKSRGKIAPLDPTDISTYQDILYISARRTLGIKPLHGKYPGLLVFDAGILPYWKDKYLMSRLFDNSPELKQLRPRWGLYPKSAEEAATILEEIPADTYVIKPRGTFMGNGVIVVHREDLADTLAYIFSKSQRLRQDPDSSYNHWASDQYPSFIVEEYCPSDPLLAPMVSAGHFDPTYRIACLLIYSRGEYTAHCLGGYGTVPKYCLEEGRTLNESHKAYQRSPHYLPIEPYIHEKAMMQLTNLLPQLHREALQK